MYGVIIEVKGVRMDKLRNAVSDLATVTKMIESSVGGVSVVEASVELKKADMGQLRARLDKEFGAGKTIWRN